MRHLFLPACFCLMTLANPTGSESGLSLDQFKGAKKSLARIAEARSADENGEPDSSQDVQAVISIPEQAITGQPAPAQAAAEQSVPLPVPRPVPKPVVWRSSQEICDTLITAAQSNDLPIPFFIHLLLQESGFRPDVVSSAGAQGIAQFMPATAATVGLDNPFDPLQAIAASARLLRDLVKQFGNLGLAAAAYNAGPRRIQDWLAKKGKLPDETQHYVKTITGRAAETWTASVPVATALTLPRHAPCREATGILAVDAQEKMSPVKERVASASHTTGRAMIATRARVKLARFAAEKTPTIIMAERASSKVANKPTKASVTHIAAAAHVAKQNGKGTKGAVGAKGAIQLAAASKKKHPKLQISQR